MNTFPNFRPNLNQAEAPWWTQIGNLRFHYSPYQIGNLKFHYPPYQIGNLKLHYSPYQIGNLRFHYSPCQKLKEEASIRLKAAFSGLRQLLATESPLKIIKSAFYITLKALFILKIFKFLF